MRKTITAITLAIVLALGTTFANAGIIVVGRSEAVDTKTQQCDPTEKSEAGIIVVGITTLLEEITGIIVVGSPDSSKGNTCTAVKKDGLLLSDSPGLLLSD